MTAKIKMRRCVIFINTTDIRCFTVQKAETTVTAFLTSTLKRQTKLQQTTF